MFCLTITSVSTLFRFVQVPKLLRITSHGSRNLFLCKYFGFWFLPWCNIIKWYFPDPYDLLNKQKTYVAAYGLSTQPQLISSSVNFLPHQHRPKIHPLQVFLLLPECDMKIVTDTNNIGSDIAKYAEIPAVKWLSPNQFSGITLESFRIWNNYRFFESRRRRQAIERS